MFYKILCIFAVTKKLISILCKMLHDGFKKEEKHRGRFCMCNFIIPPLFLLTAGGDRFSKKHCLGGMSNFPLPRRDE